MKRFFLLVLILLVGAPLVSIPNTTTTAAFFISSPAKLYGTPASLESYNWAGYAINSTSGSVSQVKGSWKQPAVTCPSSGVYVAAFWVGIDGLTSTTVEQTGTTAECVNGVASYFAWYEFYPNASVLISPVPVKPGNTISASVTYSTKTDKFTAMIRDASTGKSFSTSAAVAGAERSSAEWIEEAPASCYLITCLYAMPDFGTASYGKDTTSVTETNWATISGTTGPISKFGSTVDSLTMVTYPSGTPVMAQPSALSKDGTSFSITWVSAGP
jgi:hypothetical protein